MYKTDPSLFRSLASLRGKYLLASPTAEPLLEAVVGNFMAFSKRSSVYTGLLLSSEFLRRNLSPLSTEEIMHDHHRMRAIRDRSVEMAGHEELAKLCDYFLSRNATVFARAAATSSEVADFYDVTPWSDLLVKS